MARGDKSNNIAIEFDAARCLHARSVWGVCSLCVRSCPSGAIHVEDNQRIPALDSTLCISCGQCLAACPLDAYSSPQFSERQLLNRVTQARPVRLRCYLPYGEVDDLTTSGEYQLGSCLAAVTAGGLFELAFNRSCTLVTTHCEDCQIFSHVKSTLRCNEEAAWALLADWGKEANLQESTPLFLPHVPVAENAGYVPAEGATVEFAANPNPAFAENTAQQTIQPVKSTVLQLAENTEGELEKDTAQPTAQPAAYIAENVKSSIRSLFHGRRSRTASVAPRSAKTGPRFHTKRQHIPLWRQRLEKHWDTFGPSQATAYPWPELVIDTDKCRTCGTCMQLCPVGCIQQKLEDGQFTFTFVPGRCTNCGLCIASCATGALSRAYQTLPQPFSVQMLISLPDVACKRCGLPVFDSPEYDVCRLCRAEPKVEGIMERIRTQLGITSTP